MKLCCHINTKEWMDDKGNEEKNADEKITVNRNVVDVVDKKVTIEELVLSS